MLGRGFDFPMSGNFLLSQCVTVVMRPEGHLPARMLVNIHSERTTMKTHKRVLAVSAVSAALLLAATFAVAASTTRYLHVRVSNPANHELVRVNVPLMLAEKVVPAINHGELRNGKIHIGDFKADNIDVRSLLDALKTAPEGEFVSVQGTGNDVRVAKEHGLMVV